MAQIPKFIKGLGYSKFGGEMKVLEVPLNELGANDILVRVEAVSINPCDYGWPQMMVHQDFYDKGNVYIQGNDASGVVVKIGNSVNKFKVGDEVYYSGEFNVLKYGSNANFQIVNENIVGKKAKKLSFAEAAALPVATYTAYESFLDHMNLVDNDSKEAKLLNEKKTMLIIGGAGGVGSIATQLAKKVFGFTVIATASRYESITYCKQMGADIVINHQGSLKEQLQAIKIQGVDYILCNTRITNSLYDDLQEIINPFGYIVGIMGGEAFDQSKTFFKNVRLIYENAAARLLYNIDIPKYNERLNRISELIDRGVITSNAHVFKKFSLNTVKEEFEFSKTGKVIGKVVLSDVQQFFQS